MVELALGEVSTQKILKLTFSLQSRPVIDITSLSAKHAVHANAHGEYLRREQSMEEEEHKINRSNSIPPLDSTTLSTKC